ncbi:MAG TPA: asparagine synthase (glutamine-hydrolyzing) [Pyrinomonadaceae bacterium]|nr:asparagine synthase (glutamine-hydrolyzing) [Pyrinomonadaceae bacterium]
MCSISGIVSVSRKDLNDPTNIVKRMNSALTHRGPDDEGIAPVRTNCGHVTLGNTRLAIIDTTAAGHQPMHDPQTGNWITYNGETYNFKQLRAEIDSDPDAWRSSTDTEIVLRAYGKWGTDAFSRLRGMFALAIWDDARQQLVLARDPFGIKPLYYYRTESLFVFASEVRALLASGLVPRKLSGNGVDSYLATGSVEAPLTIVEGVRQLMPGECLQVRVDGKIQITSAHFTHTHHEANGLRSRADAVARLRSELEESLRLHLVSDVPLGVFLSGGMDSSALVALTSRITGNTPRTFSVVFDEPEYSEAPHARAIAARFNTDHCETRLTEDQLLAMLPDAITALDQPTMDGINTFVVSKAVKNAGVTVALSGLGGDELFGGYPSFRRALQVDAMSPISKRLLRAASGFGRVALNGSTQRQKFWQLAASDCRPEDVYGITRQLFAPQTVKALTSRDSLRHTNACEQLDTVNTISALELRGYMTNTLLRDTDAMSMAHSLEVRVPLVDVKVVEFALSLPGKWKLNGASSAKPLLADAVADLLPRDIVSRPKMGFTLPFEKWMQDCLRNDIAAVLENPTHARALGLSTQAVKNIWHKYLQKPRAIGWSRPWSLYVLARWCEINQVTLS